MQRIGYRLDVCIPNAEIIREVNKMGFCCYFLRTVTAHVEESSLSTRSPEYRADTEKWLHRPRFHFPASIASKWEHMTLPHWIATSMRNNLSCVELAYFSAFNDCSSYSEPNIDHQILPCLSVLSMKLHTQTLFPPGCTELVS